MTDRKRSYFSKETRHLRNGPIVAAPGDDDSANAEPLGGNRDPRMRYEHGGRAQVTGAGRAQHLEKIREPFRAGDRNRLDSAALPAREECAGVGVRARAAVAFGVLDSRSARFESRPQPFAAALPAKDHDRAAAQILQLGERGERLAVGLAWGSDHRTKSQLPERLRSSGTDGRDAQAARPCAVRAGHSASLHRRGRADENRELELIQPRDEIRDRARIFRRQDLDRGKEDRIAAGSANAIGKRASVLARARDHDTAARKGPQAHERAVRIASAPSERKFAASASPSLSGAAMGPLSSARTTLLPSGKATSPRRRICAP